MIIINADDLGRSRPETDAALSWYQAGRITSASAMVFMQDSERAAEKATECGIDIGLHLNLSQLYTGQVPIKTASAQARIARFMRGSKYAVLFYNPGLRQPLRDVFCAQMEERSEERRV